MKRFLGCTLLVFCSLAGNAVATETQISVDTPAGALAGTLLTPPTSAAGAPLVLIIPGSGPTDRDGNNPLGVHGASYRLLAEGLAAQGVASARIDKRGMFGSAHPGLDANKITLGDYASDIGAWVQKLRTTTGASCVWVLGHSEGVLVALKAAATQSKGICGLVLIAGAGRPLGDVLLEQLGHSPAAESILPQATAIVDSLRHGKPVDASDIPAPLQKLFHPAVQGFEMSAFPVDPVDLLKAYAGPVLVVQGTSDLQVDVDDAKRLAAARQGVSLTLIDGMNHVLKTPAAGKQANLASYADPDMPLSGELVPAVADVVKSRR